MARIAGIDYGTVRIGIAITDPGQTFASPYETYTRRGKEGDQRRFQRLAAEEEVSLFVVGLPVHLDGRESEKSREAREFGRWLQEATGVPVVFFDERFTTFEADQYMLDSQLTRKRRKERRDKLAAQILLTSYLESKTKGQQEPGSLDDPSCQSSS